MEHSRTVLWLGERNRFTKGLRTSRPHWGEGPFCRLWGNNASRPADRSLEKRPGSSLGKKEAAQAAGLSPFFVPPANPKSAAQNRSNHGESTLGCNRATNSPRLLTPVLANTDFKWSCTVFGVTNKWAAIAAVG